MTIEEAKYKLNEKTAEIKRKLRHRKLELLRNSSGEVTVALNGYTSTEALHSEVMLALFRGVKELVNYTYLLELDELKRKKLAMYFVMQFSFKDYKYDQAYERIWSTLSRDQQGRITHLLSFQEETRRTIISELKADYFDVEEDLGGAPMKLQWQGNRKQLAELFIELEQKKWIKFNEGQIKTVCKTLSQIFHIKDKEGTIDLNVDSFYAIFRPDPKMAAKKNVAYTIWYPKVYAPNYFASFQNINENI